MACWLDLPPLLTKSTIDSNPEPQTTQPKPYKSDPKPKLSAGGRRDAEKEAGLAEKKLQRLEASRDAEQSDLREQLDAALAGVLGCQDGGLHVCARASLLSGFPLGARAIRRQKC